MANDMGKGPAQGKEGVRRERSDVPSSAKSVWASLKEQVELLDKSLGVAFKLGVFAGGVVLLLYCLLIGYLPKDVSVGDGVFLIFIAAGFSAVYTFFLASLVCLGITLNPLWKGTHWCYAKVMALWFKMRGTTYTYEPLELKRGDGGQWLLGFFGALFVIGFSLRDWIRLPLLLLAAFFCALFVDAYQKASTKLIELDGKEVRSEEDELSRARLARTKVAFPVLIFAIPLMVGGVAPQLVTGAMRFLNIRKDDVVAHIKKPYSTLIDEGGVDGEKSVFGDDYSRYEHVDVLLSGLGSSVVLSLKTKEGKEVKIAAPADQVLYRPSH